MTVTFPDRRSPDTGITLEFDQRGEILRYSETRGMPTPSRTIEEMQAQMRNIVRTYIQMNYADGGGLAINSYPGEPDVAVSGPVTAFLSLGVLGDVEARVALVRQLCSA